MFGKTSQKEYLTHILKHVKVFMEENGINVPFFIAGGSIASALNGVTEYGDIDVYFYNEDDVLYAIDMIPTIDIVHISDNAATFRHKGDLIQFVKIVTGDPKDVLDTFDINSSRCAFTSDNKLIKGRDYSKKIKIDFNNFSSSTHTRYNKYFHQKKCTDPGSVTRTELLTFLVDNIDTAFPHTYIDECEKSGLNMLFQLLRSDMGEDANDTMTIDKQVHDLIVDKIEPYDRIAVFEKLIDVLGMEVEKACDEFVLAWATHHRFENIQFAGVRDQHRDRINEVKLIYPEYFI